MAKINEKVKVTALEFLNKENDFNECKEFISPYQKSKIYSFNWGLEFAIASVFCEVCFKIGVETLNVQEWNTIDKLFSVSPVSTYINFKGNKEYYTGEIPKEGALACWRRGNGWQGHINVVNKIDFDKGTFSVVEARIKMGDEGLPIVDVIERENKSTKNDYAKDKLNFLYSL